ncbi:hypothetical protein [Roseinatronobacter sp.]
MADKPNTSTEIMRATQSCADMLERQRDEWQARAENAGPAPMTTRILSIIGAIAIAAQLTNFAYGAYHGATGRDAVQCPNIAYAYARGLWGTP